MKPLPEIVEVLVFPTVAVFIMVAIVCIIATPFWLWDRHRHRR